MSVARNITEVVGLIIGLALAGLIISRSSQTAEVVASFGQALSGVLESATAQHASMGVSH